MTKIPSVYLQNWPANRLVFPVPLSNERWNALYNVFTGDAVDLSVHSSNKEHTKYMKEREDRHVVVVETHTFDRGHTITIMKHEHRYVVVIKYASMDDAIAVVII